MLVAQEDFMNKSASKPPLTFQQYGRIHDVIYSLAQHFTHNEGKECVFYSINAAAIMHAHYGKRATVVCGLGALVVHRQGDVPTAVSWFQEQPDGQCIATPEAFHCWVECDGWVIDFSAPNYQRTLETSFMANTHSVPRIPRKMLQKPVAQASSPMSQLTRVGRAVFAPDQEVTTHVIDGAFAKPSTEDVAHIACNWHRPPPLPLPPSITIANDLGKVITIPAIHRELVGAW